MRYQLLKTSVPFNPNVTYVIDLEFWKIRPPGKKEEAKTEAKDSSKDL